MKTYYRSYVEIDLGAIRENFSQLRACLSPGVKALSVVKADAYGHGSVAVARALENETDWFAVACADEGVVLRKAGIRKPILILSYSHPLEFSDILSFDLTPCMFDLSDAKKLSQEAKKMGKCASVHLKVDTGMGRVGVPCDESGADMALAISRLPNLNLEGLFSHMACADSADPAPALEQCALFDRFIGLLESRGVSVPIKHICNSAGTIEGFPQYDMCRFGIALYGIYPSNEVRRDRVMLKPAMSVYSHVSQVKQVPEGTKIGYGHIYTAPEKRVIATVSIGYADGYPRCMTGVGSVLIGGISCPVVGKVCMDQIMVDVSEVPSVAVGDRVTVLGRDGNACISAEAFGSLCHSFSYEVVCTFLPRVKRVYREETEK